MAGVIALYMNTEAGGLPWTELVAEEIVESFYLAAPHIRFLSCTEI